MVKWESELPPKEVKRTLKCRPFGSQRTKRKCIICDADFAQRVELIISKEISLIELPAFIKQIAQGKSYDYPDKRSERKPVKGSMPVLIFKKKEM
jgi:hypothetical protein